MKETEYKELTQLDNGGLKELERETRLGLLKIRMDIYGDKRLARTNKRKLRKTLARVMTFKSAKAADR